MAKLTRKFLSRYGQSGIVNDYAVFGSKAAGAPVNSLDVAAIQTLTAWTTGLKDTLQGGQRAPFLEDDNAWRLVHAYMACYMFQEGIPEWDGTTTYFTNSIVKKPGTYEFYASLIDNNTGNALPTETDNANWAFIFPNLAKMLGQVVTAQIGTAQVTDNNIVGMSANKLTGDIISQFGVITFDHQSSCRYAKTSARQTIPSAGAQVTFDTKIYDIQSEFSTGTSKFTATRAGIYHVTFMASWFNGVPSGAETWNMIIGKNGDGLSLNSFYAQSGFRYTVLQGVLSSSIQLAPGDTIAAAVAWSGSGSPSLDDSVFGANLNYATWIEIVKVA